MSSCSSVTSDPIDSIIILDEKSRMSGSSSLPFQPDNGLPSRLVPHSRWVSTYRWRWMDCRSHVASIAPTIGARRYTHRKRVWPEKAAGPNCRAGFTLPPVEVPSVAIAVPIATPTIKGTNGANRGAARQTPTRKTMTAILKVSQGSRSLSRSRHPRSKGQTALTGVLRGRPRRGKR